MRAEWLSQAVFRGLELADIPVLEAEMVRLAQLDGTWEVGVISPSLVSTTCPLQRMKKFLGHDPVPGGQRFMAMQAGRVNSMTAVSFLRGFWGERLVLAALKHGLPGNFIIDSAPTCRVDATMIGWRTEGDVDGMVFKMSGHPDLICKSAEDGSLGIVQIKTPSVFKLDRIEREGESEVWSTYLPQLATEMTILHRAGFPISWGAMLLFGWEGSPKIRKPRALTAQVEWDELLETHPQRVANEIAYHLHHGTMPEAIPESEAGRFPCSYCSFSRIASPGIPACDDHAAWKEEKVEATQASAG